MSENYCSACANGTCDLPTPSPEMLPRDKEAREYIEVHAKSIKGFEWVVQFDIRQLGTQDPFGAAKELADTYFQTVYPFCKEEYVLSMFRKVMLG